MDGGWARPFPRPWWESLLLCALDEECAEGVCPADAEGLRGGMAGESPPGARRGRGRVCGTRSSVRESDAMLM